MTRLRCFAGGIAALALIAASSGCRRVAEKFAEKGAAAMKDTSKGLSEIELIVDNPGNRPLRITRLDVFAQDGKGFVKRPVTEPGELTVPPRAKDKLVVAFDSGTDKLVKARIWGVDHDLPAPASR